MLRNTAKLDGEELIFPQGGYIPLATVVPVAESQKSVVVCSPTKNYV